MFCTFVVLDMFNRILLTLALLCSSVVLIGIVVYELMVDIPENGCTMTWMYEYPEYLKVQLSSSVQKKFPKYGLYIYGEGVYANYLTKMNGNYKLDGIPALFVHGNAGKYKQVRSPASVSLRKSESRRYHFNYFSIDYEEELSALYGPFLYRQTEYLYHSIQRIFQCYSHLKIENRPQTIIAIGHSMGGLILRGIHSLHKFSTIDSFQHEMLNTIVTLASPHTKPPVTLDSDLYTFYHHINNFWNEEGVGSLNNITLLSLGGGIRDFQVHSQLCFISTNNVHHFSSITTSIPGIWLATDHQCIVWCNELVRATTRAFFYFIDSKTRQITLNSTKRFDILSRLFVDKGFERRYEQKQQQSTCQQLSVKDGIIRKKITSGGCYILNITDLQGKQGVNIWAKTSTERWVYFCEAGTCFSVDYQTLPSVGTQKSNFLSSKNENVIMLKLNSNDKLCIEKSLELSFYVRVPILLTSPFFFEFKETMFLIVPLHCFTEAWQVYEIEFDITGKNPYFVQIDVPWSNENEIFTIKSSKQTVKIHLFSDKPSHNNVQLINMKIWSKSFRNISFTIRPCIMDSFARIVQVNAELVLRYILMFGMIRSVLYASSFGEKSFLLLLSRHKSVLLICLLLSFKLMIWLKTNGFTSQDRMVNFFLSELCCIAFGAIISDGLHILYSIFLQVLLFLVYPISALVRKVNKIIPPIYVYALSALLAAVWMSYGIPASLTLLTLVVVDIILINTKNKDEIILFKNIFLGFIPTVLLFSIVPTVVFIKDMIDGFPHEFSSFTNIIVLTATYCCYQVLHLNVDIILNVSRISKIFKCLLLFISFLGFFTEIVVFYNLTYVACLYLVYVTVHM